MITIDEFISNYDTDTLEMELTDSYKIFMNKFNITPKELITFGLEETKFGDDIKIKEAWEQLKERIKNPNTSVYIRGYGRDAHGTKLFEQFYINVLETQVKKDPSNNTEPSKLISDLTGLSKIVPSKKSTKKQIYNYQISHIFGKTKNIYTFTAPWNIVYMPKILDPFTGHEAKGNVKEAFQEIFQRYCFEKFKSYIEEYNEIVTNSNFIKRKKTYLDSLDDSEKTIQKFKEIVTKEFSPIEEKELGSY